MDRSSFVGLLTLIILYTTSTGWSQADYPWLRTGDELYVNRAYTDAETAYRKALEEKEEPKTAFNLGNTIYRQHRIPEAITQYESTIEGTKDTGIKADAWYNLGNAHYQNQDFEKSVQAYKESLKLRPEDEDAKKNLMLSLRQLRQQQQQQQQQDQQQEEKDKPQNQDQQQQPNSEQKENQDQQQSSSQEQSKSEQEQQTREELSKEEAKEILKAIEREDQRVQEKLKKGNAKALPPVKDW